jgi:hypothetical protein
MYESLFCSFQEGVNVGSRHLDKLKVRLTKPQPQLAIKQSCSKVQSIDKTSTKNRAGVAEPTLISTNNI